MSRAKRLAEKRIEKAYYRSCAGVQIDILDIPKVFKAGHALIAKGVTEPELETGIRAAVEELNKRAADEAVTNALRRGDHIDPGAIVRRVSPETFQPAEPHKTEPT